MRRPAVIATLLLPLPFAALPVISLLFTGGGQAANGTVAVIGQPPAEASVTEAPAMQEQSQDAPVAYGVEDPRDCPRSSDSVIEG